jgi:hypothetical protein
MPKQRKSKVDSHGSTPELPHGDSDVVLAARERSAYKDCDRHCAPSFETEGKRHVDLHQACDFTRRRAGVLLQSQRPLSGFQMSSTAALRSCI